MASMSLLAFALAAIPAGALQTAVSKDSTVQNLAAGAQIECNSDADCQVDEDQAFRCMDSTLIGLELKETAKNSCRLPGNGPKPNNTCVCQDLGGAGNGGCFSVDQHAEDSTKTQYLLIGDCIGAWVDIKIGDSLAEKGFEVVRANAPSNAASVNLGMHCVDGWLPKSRKWDVISFSFGLHDISHNTEHLTLEQYTRLFTKFTKKLVAEQQRSGAKLIFANAVPVPKVPVIDSDDCTQPLSGGTCLMPPRFDHEMIEHNEAAAEVIKSAIATGAEIEILDIYGKFTELCGGAGYSFCKYQQDYNVHPSPEGNDMIGGWYLEKLLSVTGKA